MFRIKDGDRILEFEGERIAHSSSQKKDSERWAEFDLYRTIGGRYVLSRIGRSLVFHAPPCEEIRRSGTPVPVATLGTDSVACQTCRPNVDADFANQLVVPEKEIPWAMVYADPEAVIDALIRTDNGGNRYFTNVARNLLRAAAREDRWIRDAYQVERIY
jgi:hypothetical protein